MSRRTGMDYGFWEGRSQPAALEQTLGKAVGSRVQQLVGGTTLRKSSLSGN